MITITWEYYDYDYIHFEYLHHANATFVSVHQRGKYSLGPQDIKTNIRPKSTQGLLHWQHERGGLC